MPLGCCTAWLELQAPHHVEDRLLAEHDLEERVLVEQEDVAEDLVEVVEPLHILQVLREHVLLVELPKVHEMGSSNSFEEPSASDVSQSI